MQHRAGTIHTLNSGIPMPDFGLGCFRATGDTVYRAVRTALEAGYRMFDTATRYENEKEIGSAIRDSHIAREEIFLVSKLWPTSFEHPRAGLDYSLRQLDCGYIDGYYLHWPGTDRALRLRAWEALLNAAQQGDIRSVGVSNFTQEHLENLIEAYGVVPAVNQIELHPWYPQKELCAFCAGRGMMVTAWAPIFHGHIEEVPLIYEIAQEYGRSAVQITLRWHIQRGHIVIAKSAQPERIIANAHLFDFALSETDMARIDALACGRHFGKNPDVYDGRDFTIAHRAQH